eukprot:TRINITY_DN63971_c0_g1_i1.p1 TRINITY_DN63971_c0_g1~~TRINITY_DN63971_c0_g1_i1.p1  ORF type:complete len:357 (+),score=77.23 TRINITY_DN63971_c0_g1_i1:142-1212(+)
MGCQMAYAWNYLQKLAFVSAKRRQQITTPKALDPCGELWQSIDELVIAGPEILASASEKAFTHLQDVLNILDREGSELATRLLQDDAPARLLAHLDLLDFESRKSSMHLVSAISKSSPEGALLAYLRRQPEYIKMLLEGLGNPNISIHCSSMLKACMCSHDLVGELLHQGAATRIIELAGKEDFDVSSEAFASLRELVMAYPEAAAHFLEANFENFFGSYHSLVEATESYATRRRALKLLSEVLLSRPFGAVMVRYVSDSEFLQLHMNMMRDSSAAIRLEVFHVFKIFAANPRKPRRVELILLRNKERLIKLLENSVAEKSRADEALLNDLQTVISILEDLRAETARGPLPSQAGS